MSQPSGRSLEKDFPAFLRDHTAPETSRKLRQLGRDLDRLVRRDSVTQELYIHEPSLRALLNRHSPTHFGKRYLRLMKGAPDGRLVRDAHVGRRDAVVPLEEAAFAVGTATPEGTPEALGLTPDSSLEDLRSAIEPHVAELPDQMYTPDLGERLKQAVARMDRAAEAGSTTELAPDYWEQMKICFGTRAGIWWELALLVFIWAFTTALPATGGDVVAAIVAALIIAGIAVAVWFLWSLVYCLVRALF